MIGDKQVAGHFAERLQDSRVADATLGNLAFDHLDARLAVVHSEIVPH